MAAEWLAVMQNKDSPSEDTAIIEFIDDILREAVNGRASDIHFEPYQEHYRIRLRIDGLLNDKTKTSVDLGPRFSARLKIMANLDIAEKRLPQDGRFRVQVAGKNHDCRLSICPTIFGEKLVVRILNPINLSLDLDNLDLNFAEREIFYKYIHMPQGLILVTGPTGSGKTFTLYTALSLLNQTTKNISTVEDPVEINLTGINQVEINHRIGINFAKILRTLLRQDPDIIMIGEIRDLETAQIAIKAAYTGHLVLATLHTNSAAASLTRLINMGIAAFDLANAVSLIIAQRLVRKICPKCKKANTVKCNDCNDGYKDRMAIFEMLPITQELQELIANNYSQLNLEQKIRALKIPNLRAAAMQKVQAGITDIAEVNRVMV